MNVDEEIFWVECEMWECGTHLGLNQSHAY